MNRATCLWQKRLAKARLYYDREMAGKSPTWTVSEIQWWLADFAEQEIKRARRHRDPTTKTNKETGK
jgi:hypothetical protein